MTVTDQINITVSVLIRYWRCLRKSKEVSHRYLIGNSRSRFATRACVAFFGLIISSLPGFSETGHCGYKRDFSPYITYHFEGKVLSRTLILDDGVEYPCKPLTLKNKTTTGYGCGPLVIGWQFPYSEERCIYGRFLSRDCFEDRVLLMKYFLIDKSRKAFNLKPIEEYKPDFSNENSMVYRSDAVVDTQVKKWRILDTDWRDTDQRIRLRTVVECPAKNLPRPSL